jgi:hypothetical protein
VDKSPYKEGVSGQVETHFLYISNAKYPPVHLYEQSIVKGSLYRLGVVGQTVTHVFVETSLYNFAVELQVSVQVLVVLSA